MYTQFQDGPMKSWVSEYYKKYADREGNSIGVVKGSFPTKEDMERAVRMRSDFKSMIGTYPQGIIQ